MVYTLVRAALGHDDTLLTLGHNYGVIDDTLGVQINEDAAFPEP